MEALPVHPTAPPHGSAVTMEPRADVGVKTHPLVFEGSEA